MKREKKHRRYVDFENAKNGLDLVVDMLELSSRFVTLWSTACMLYVALNE